MTQRIAAGVVVKEPLSIEHLWSKAGFTPNEAQRAAILHVNGPLYLPAGPGSGKTRVLLWRTLNLIVFHNVPPEAIYLSTFTEKAARQLKEGLRALLGFASNLTGQPYDISQMYVGTVHALCQRLIMDRRFYSQRQRRRPPTLLDDLGQYLYLYRRSRWEELARWSPVIPIPFEPEHVAETVRQFSEVVDLIEDGRFTPADLTTLHRLLPGATRTFASAEICRRCDARFSCASYRACAHAASQGVEASFREYFDDYWG